MTYARSKSVRAAPAFVVRDPQINLLGAADQAMVGVHLRDAPAQVAALKVCNELAADDAKARAA